MIDVVLTDDHPWSAPASGPLFRAPDMRVVREYATTDEPTAWIATGGHADVILLDLRFGGSQRGGPEGTGDRRSRRAADPDPDHLRRRRRHSRRRRGRATGYLLKDAATDELTAAIRAAAVGEATLGPTIQQRLPTRLRRPDTSLTLRELDVLRHVS